LQLRQDLPQSPGAGNTMLENVTEYAFRRQQCPVCTGAGVRLLGRRGGSAHRLGLGVPSSIYQCRGCELIFPDPMPVPSHIDEHYGDAEEYFVEHSFEGKQAGYEGVLDSLAELGATPGRLLDIGAGRGELLRAALMRGWDAVGLEPAANFARVARQYSGAQVVEAKLEQRPFPENSFDAVTLGAVLEHVFNPAALLIEINRVLRPGGVLWLDVPNEAGLFYLLGNLYQRIRGRDWVVNLSPTFPPYHVFGFTPKALRCLLRVTGFESIRLKTYATYAVIETQNSPVPAGVRQLVRWILWLGELAGAGTYMDAWGLKR
jgi:SAM-dependent methyltransferase